MTDKATRPLQDVGCTQLQWLIIVHNLQLKVAHYDYRDFLCLGVCPFAFGYMVVSVVITHKVFK